jgi:hypothetical protein
MIFLLIWAHALFIIVNYNYLLILIKTLFFRQFDPLVDPLSRLNTVKVALYKNKLLRHIALLNFNGATSVDSLCKKHR